MSTRSISACWPDLGVVRLCEATGHFEQTTASNHNTFCLFQFTGKQLDRFAKKAEKEQDKEKAKMKKAMVRVQQSEPYQISTTRLIWFCD